MGHIKRKELREIINLETLLCRKSDTKWTRDLPNRSENLHISFATVVQEAERLGYILTLRSRQNLKISLICIVGKRITKVFLMEWRFIFLVKYQ
jgi:hypothetical protein